MVEGSGPTPEADASVRTPWTDWFGIPVSRRLTPDVSDPLEQAGRSPAIRTVVESRDWNYLRDLK